MFKLIKQVLIALLSFSRTSATNYMSWNNEASINKDIKVNADKYNQGLHHY